MLFFHGFNVTVVCFEAIWMFPKIVVPPNHPFVHRVFPLQTIHFWIPIFGNIHIFFAGLGDFSSLEHPVAVLVSPGWQDVGLENLKVS